MGLIEWAERRQREREERLRKALLAVGRAIFQSGRWLVRAAPSIARTAGKAAAYGLVLAFAIVRVAMSLALWAVVLGALYLMVTGTS